MADQDRTDAVRATNASLTSPREDTAGSTGDYPGLPGGREQVRTGRSPDDLSPPGYAAPAGRSINPDADPAAGVAATDLDEGRNPDAGGAVNPQPGTGRSGRVGVATGANADPDRASHEPAHHAGVAPGAASMDHAHPDAAPTAVGGGGTGGQPAFDAPPPELLNTVHPNAAAGRVPMPGEGIVSPDAANTAPGHGRVPGGGTSHRAGGREDDASGNAGGDDRGPGSGSSDGSAGLAARVTSDPNFLTDAARLGAQEEQRNAPGRQGP